MGEDQLNDLELEGLITLRILNGIAWDSTQAKWWMWWKTVKCGGLISSLLPPQSSRKSGQWKKTKSCLALSQSDRMSYFGILIGFSVKCFLLQKAIKKFANYKNKIIIIGRHKNPMHDAFTYPHLAFKCQLSSMYVQPFLRYKRIKCNFKAYLSKWLNKKGPIDALANWKVSTTVVTSAGGTNLGHLFAKLLLAPCHNLNVFYQCMMGATCSRETLKLHLYHNMPALK